MMTLEQKHLALLDEAQRRGLSEMDNMRLCFEVLALANAIDRACASRLAPHHLSEGKFVLLFLLRDRPEGLAPHELADRAGVTRATITGLLDGLERDGFLDRHRDKEDRRKVSVRLTVKGQGVARGLFEEHSQWIGSLFAGFNQDERDALSTLLRRVWRNIEIPAEDSAAVAAHSL
ncbi:MarR family transcriptional regulator [Mesorhizobium sp. RMAD-H1]|uniref:MarR family winged helix-turn-helix transcriptional regulator n=1 Tax=Mesorhizobium sp. RMAD-H1 TaxID=2587065 RepID=UPI00161B1DD7|nr:MarR family transcriptional regulator [Mesorhizobium sp. RMAD-H1]MBB2973709.1 DNA-binding MarR family transcriptional regulator [Mesorhizobium sp. RMAD-H1]